MANGSVYDKIIALGKVDAENIIKEGQNKANSITEQIINLTNEKIEQMINDAKVRNAEKVKSQNAVLEQNKKQVLLANQKRIIQETFAKVLEKLCDMNDNELESFVKTYLEKSGLKEEIVIKVSNQEYDKYIKLFSSNNTIILN